MNKLLVFFLSLIVSLNSFAEWKKIYSDDEETIYLDLNTIKKYLGSIYWWNLVDLKVSGRDGEMSGKVYMQGDCAITRTKLLTAITYSQPMGEEELETRTPDDPNWNFQPPDSIGGFLLDTSCKLLNASEKVRNKILEEIQSDEEIKKLIEAEDAAKIANEAYSYKLQSELIDLQILLQEKSQEIQKLDNLRASYRKDETMLLIIGLENLIKENEQKLLNLNNQIEDAKLIYENEKFKELSQVEIELEEILAKREAAQEAFETEQFNRLITEEVQAEQDLERQVKLEQYLDRLKSAYINNIAAKVRSLWRYQGAEDNWTAEVYVLQDRDGNVLSVNIQNNNVGNSSKAKVFMDSIERAIYKSSPLPKAPDEAIFTKEITFRFGVN